MGLRAQGLLWTLGLSLGLGGLGLGALTWQLQRSFEDIETEQLRADALRLQAGLAELVAQPARGAREWSIWTEMRNFLLRPDPPFAAHNLTPAAIRASGLDWVVVLDLRGQPVWSARADGRPLDLAALLARHQPRGQRLVAMPPPEGHCALDRWLGDLQVICQLPIRDSEARDPPSGVLLTSELIGADQLASLGNQLGLRFDLLPPARAGSGEAFDGPPGSLLQRGEIRHLLQWPLRVGEESAHSTLRLDWPRQLHLQTQRALQGAQAVLIGVALLLALAILLLIEWRLVLRLRRVQRHLAALRASEQWQQRLPVDGHDEVAALAEEGNHLLARIERQLQVLAEQSRTDILTGLVNRRGFEEALSAALARAQRSSQPLVLLLLDADHFKRFNDRHGHPAGDRALQLLARGLREVGARRAGDLAARWGGEEFVLLYEGCPPGVAAERFEALRSWLREQPIGEALAAPLTVSAGLALARPDDRPEDLVQRADAALYVAKGNGRDRLAVET